MQITSRTTRMKKKDLTKIRVHDFACFVHMLSICRRIFARLAIHDICMICDCAVFSMLRSSCAYAQLEYFALDVYLLVTLTI